MAQEMYFLYLDGVQRGPYTVHQIGHMVNSGIVHSDALFWCEGLDQWQPVTQLITPKSEVHRRRLRWSAGTLGTAAMLLVFTWMMVPILRQGWREQHQVDPTPKAAYWRARGVLREHLGRLNPIAFNEFLPEDVQMKGSARATVDLGVQPWMPGSHKEPVRWRVEVLYDSRLKAWVPGEASPVRR